MPLSLKEAQTAVELARVHAEKIGVPMTIAVVDGGGHLLAFARMNKSILGSIDIALKKAKTSVLFNAPSEGHWHDDAVHLTKESDIRATFAPLLKGQFDPQEMIDKMVEPARERAVPQGSPSA
jgi:uncharacterized protein GlcG (DUF336 family)